MNSIVPGLYSFSYGSSNIASAAGKMYVPVSKSALLYSHFDHVSGVAASNGQSGVSISKLRILNSLIERVSSIKNEPVKEIKEIDPKQADILIQNYQKQLQQAMQIPYMLNGAQPMSGDLFSLLA